MYHQVERTINEDLDALRAFSNHLAKNYALIAINGEDLRRIVYVDVRRRCHHTHSFAGQLLNMPKKRRRGYLCTWLVNAARGVQKKEKCWLRESIPFDDLLRNPDFSPSEMEDARRVMANVRGRLGEEGRFALEVFLQNAKPADLAPRFGIGRPFADRRFDEGVGAVARAAEAILGCELGGDALREFIRLVRIYREFGTYGHGATGSR